MFLATAHAIFMAFGDLESKNTNFFLKRQYACAGANNKKKPYGASQLTWGTSENAQSFRSVTYRIRE